MASDLEALNKSLRALNASIGHYIDRLTRNRTPQEVLELFDQYEEKVVAAAYHRFKTSDNLFNYRAYLEEELDDCEAEHLPLAGWITPGWSAVPPAKPPLPCVPSSRNCGIRWKR